MARSSADRSDAGDEDIDETTGPDTDDPQDDSDEEDLVRSAAADAFWADVQIAPVELALPGGVGYTLRAYRISSDITPSDYSARESDEFVTRSPAAFRSGVDDEHFLDDEDEFDEESDGEPGDDEPGLAEDEHLLDDEDEGAAGGEGEPAEPPAEEVPLFLSHAGRLLLFRTRTGLADFVRSGADNDLAQLAQWPSVVERIRDDDVVALPEDTYELDLVVKNLRSGHDAWDAELLVQSGELARDVGHALHIEPVVLAMAAGSPLDDLDEAMRAVAGGGFGAFRARRRVKRIGVETASIGWRTVIGKISAVVDWRD